MNNCRFRQLRSWFRTVIAVAFTVVAACSTQQVIDIALTKDPQATLEVMGKNKLASYKSDPRVLKADFDRVNAELKRLFGTLKQESGKKWGEEESQKLPGPKRYVKYTEKYKNRIIVDYETSTIRIEHLQEPKVADRLRRAVVVALLTPQDPRYADVFSDKEVELTGKPYLQDSVLNQNNAPLRSRADVEDFAGFLVANRLQSRTITVGNAPVDVAYVEMTMIGAEQDRMASAPPRKPVPKRPPGPGRPPPPANQTPDPKAGERADPNRYAAADQLAPKFLDMVNRHARATGVDPALIMAIIYQESRFNPQAVSQAEAYGMMQLVPSSGGFEAFQKVTGEAVQPTREYLMDPDRNIELGATYVNMLLFEQWPRNIGNFPSREYCAISAYNTGPGNLARAFTGSTGKIGEAQNKANSMRPDQVFDYLRTNLPYAETRDYLLRVSAARMHYKQLFFPES